jgi:hypothetical protein
MRCATHGDCQGAEDYCGCRDGSSAASETAATASARKGGGGEMEERWIRYRPPLVVPVAPEFDLNSVNEVFCIEFFR